MTIFGIYNLKGGVGKTVSAVNLAYLAAKSGFRTVLWDLDPQGAASFYLKSQKQPEIDMKRIVKGKDDIREIVQNTDYPNLFVIPIDFEFRNIDIELDDMKKSKNRIRQSLKALREDYDLVFLDSPPSISVLSENIFRASDYLLVPVIPTTLSLRTLEYIKQFYRENDLDQSPILPFFSMVQARKSLHKEAMELVAMGNQNMCTHWIPLSSDIERMALRKKPINASSKKSSAAIAYEALWHEIMIKTNLAVT